MADPDRSAGAPVDDLDGDLDLPEPVGSGGEMEAARLATLDDVPAIVAIAERVREELADGRGGELFLAREAGPWPMTDRLEAAIRSSDAVVVVGSYAEYPFGYGIARVEELDDGRLLGRLDDLAVDPEARASGIGEAMMDLILSELRSAGCEAVDSRALPGDRSTKNFFESFGLKARLLVVTYDLGEVDGEA